MRFAPGLRERLAVIQLFVIDVDGVLTGGEVIYSDSGEEMKIFDIKDGLGIRVASEVDLRVALITARLSPIVQRRARDLHVSEVLQHVGDKATALRSLAESSGISLEQVAYMGDDLIDREAMRIAGVSFAPSDAVPEIKAEADVITEAGGGQGAARQAVEAILRAQGKWEEAVDRYLAQLAKRDHNHV